MQLGGVHHLRFGGASRGAFHRDSAHEESWRTRERKLNSPVGGAFALGSEVGVAPGGKKNAKALLQLTAIERFARMRGDQSTQHWLIGVVDTRELDFPDLRVEARRTGRCGFIPCLRTTKSQ